LDEETYNQIQALAKRYHCSNSRVFDQVLKEKELIWNSFEDYMGKTIDKQLESSLNKKVDSFVTTVLGRVLTSFIKLRKV